MAARQQPHPRPPLSTDHAQDRFVERARHDRDEEIDLWTAWIDAEPIDLPVPWCHAGDEARYHHDSQVILCRRDTSITTVYDVVGEDAHPAVQRAVKTQFDIADNSL